MPDRDLARLTLPRGLQRVVSSPALAACAIVGALVLITALRFGTYSPDDGLNMLFCLPIIAAAFRFGPVGGVLCGAAALGLFVAWAYIDDGPTVSAMGYASRSFVFLLLGWSLGWLASARRRLRHEQARQAEHVSSLLGQLARVREEERQRISSDLHDFVLQDLLASLMHVERALPVGADAAGNPLASVDRLVRDAARSTRRIIDGIEPLDLEHVTTAQLLEQAVAAVEHDYGLAVDLDLAVDLPGLEDAATRHLAYRVVTEALRNVAKHAEGARACVRARASNGLLHLEVRDEGQGLAAPLAIRDRLDPAFGTGFNLLLEQLLARGGAFAIDSAPGTGTTVAISVPAGPPAPAAQPS